MENEKLDNIRKYTFTILGLWLPGYWIRSFILETMKELMDEHGEDYEFLRGDKPADIIRNITEYEEAWIAYQNPPVSTQARYTLDKLKMVDGVSIDIGEDQYDSRWFQTIWIGTGINGKPRICMEAEWNPRHDVEDEEYIETEGVGTLEWTGDIPPDPKEFAKAINGLIGRHGWEHWNNFVPVTGPAAIHTTSGNPLR